MVDFIFLNGTKTASSIINITDVTYVDAHIETQGLLITNGFYRVNESERLLVGFDEDGEHINSVITIDLDSRKKYLAVLDSCDEWFYGIKELKNAFNSSFEYMILL